MSFSPWNEIFVVSILFILPLISTRHSKETRLGEGLSLSWSSLFLIELYMDETRHGNRSIFHYVYIILKDLSVVNWGFTPSSKPNYHPTKTKCPPMKTSITMITYIYFRTHMHVLFISFHKISSVFYPKWPKRPC